MTADGSVPTLVLIHGGAHSARCWDFVVDEIAHRAPWLHVLAVDLPGRPNRAASPDSPTLSNYADVVVAEIERARLGRIVVAGHSLGGLTALRVVAELGYPRVRELILIAAVTPPHGSSVVDTLPWPLAHVVRRAAAKPAATLPMPPMLGRVILWNRLPRDRSTHARSQLCREPAQMLLERADYADLPRQTWRTWILTRRDRVVSVRRQHAYMTCLGGVDTLLSVDTCHDVMFSEPSWLAERFVERCHLHRATAAPPL